MNYALDMLRRHVGDLDCQIATLENEIGRLTKKRDPLYRERDVARLALAAIEPEEDE